MKNKTKVSKLFCSLKSQAAMEFLMSYGWAVLLLLIAIGALTAFGVFDPKQFYGGKCKIHGGFFCEDFKIDGSKDLVILVIRNTLGFEANDVTVSVNSATCVEADLDAAAQASGNVVISGNDNIIDGKSIK